MKRKKLNGYWIVYVPEHFGCMQTKNYRGWAYEHRYLIEKSLGRKLGRFEIVHHKNGNKLDNRLENLALMSIEEHTKLHSTKHHDRRCKVCGCRISKYAAVCKKHSVRSGPLSFVDTKELVRSVAECGFEATGRKYQVSGSAVRRKLIRSGMTPEEVKHIRH